MKHKKQVVIIVTAYGEDNLFQKQYEDIVGIYTSCDKAIKGAMKDGMTNAQLDYLNRTNSFYMLNKALNENNIHANCQVEYWKETDARKKPCVSSYMFRVYNID